MTPAADLLQRQRRLDEQLADPHDPQVLEGAVAAREAAQLFACGQYRHLLAELRALPRRGVSRATATEQALIREGAANVWDHLVMLKEQGEAGHG